MVLFHFHRYIGFDFKSAGPWEGEAGGEVFDGAVVGVRAKGEGVVAVKERGEDVVKAGVLLGKAGVGVFISGVIGEGGGVFHLMVCGELVLQWDADVCHKADVLGVAHGAEVKKGASGFFTFPVGEGFKAVGNEGVGAKDGADGADAIAGGVPAGVGVNRIKVGTVGEDCCKGRVGLVGFGNVCKAKDGRIAF